MDIPAVCERFLDSYRAYVASEGSVETMRKVLGAIQRAFAVRGCFSIADVQFNDVEAVLEDWFERGLSVNYRCKLASSMRQLFKFAFDQGFMLRDVSLVIDLARRDGPTVLPPKPLSEEAIATIIGALPRRTVVDLRNIALLEIMYGCGLRCFETLDLNLEDMDLKERVLLVRHGKGDKDRLLPIMPTALQALRDYLILRRSLLRGPDTGALWIGEVSGTRLKRSYMQRFFKRLNKQHGKRFGRIHPHLLRHSIAVHLLRGGADIRHVQAFLGHEDLDTTKIYLRLVPGQLAYDYQNGMPLLMP